MRSEYRLTARSLIFDIARIVGHATVSTAAIAVFLYFHPITMSGKWLIFAACYGVTCFLPCGFLLWQYYYISKSMEVSIDSAARSIAVTIAAEKSVFPFDQVRAIKVNLVSSRYRGRTVGFFPWERFSYAELDVREHGKVLLTSLLIPDLCSCFQEHQLDYVKQKVLFPVAGFEDSIENNGNC